MGFGSGTQVPPRWGNWVNLYQEGKMKKRVPWSIIVASLFVLTCTLPASAAFDWEGAGVIRVADPAVNPGQDISQVLFGSDTTSYYFRMDLAAAPGHSDLNTWYGIYLGTSGVPLDSPFQADFGLEATWRTFGSSPLFSPVFTDFTNPSHQISGQFFSQGNVLEWQVAKDALQSEWFTALSHSPSISFLGATLNAQGALIDSSPVAATPIPGAAWLLASGLIGLIGLRRKNA